MHMRPLDGFLLLIALTIGCGHCWYEHPASAVQSKLCKRNVVKARLTVVSVLTPLLVETDPVTMEWWSDLKAVKYPRVQAHTLTRMSVRVGPGSSVAVRSHLLYTDISCKSWAWQYWAVHSHLNIL